ncbi:uncharacterized protein LOC110855077 isoform X2 [Folsomia candida]|uniref:uncharacterized protein LOC110855077 isoform X2 n=1 Tax=Folsomia candida TaxID=158441 RepID=UPI0016054439|nr:uncharacterized protein LOC110855077 isoform X2 [Folsomia candida]
MATFTTFADLSTAPPAEPETTTVLRLRLTNRASDLHRNREQLNDLGIQQTWRQSFFNLLPTAPWAEQIELGTEPEGVTTEAETEENLRKLRAHFAKMRDAIQAHEVSAIREMRQLPGAQQRQVLTFWEHASVFFMDVLKWLEAAFLEVLDKIKQGFKIVKKVLADIFKTVNK